MITTTILQILHTTQGHPLAETVLLTEVRLNAGHCGEREFQTALQRLKGGEFAESNEDPLTGDTRWNITDKGLKHIGGK